MIQEKNGCPVLFFFFLSHFNSSTSIVPILLLKNNENKIELKCSLLPNYSDKGKEHHKSSLAYAILAENPILWNYWHIMLTKSPGSAVHLI